jgi:predicted RNA-binding Zn ribbon-like protein
MAIEGFDFSTVHPLHERLCLDYVNSTPNHSDPSEGYLNTYTDLVSWSLDVKLMSEDEARRLIDLARRQPAQAKAIHDKAIVLREAIYRILSSIAQGQEPETADLDVLNAGLSEAMAHMRLKPAGKGFIWEWETDDLEFMLWQVAWSAGELLRSEDLKYLRKCEGCDWLFLDTSRNHSRRWCDMRTCGNRAKARRHYERMRGE